MKLTSVILNISHILLSHLQPGME